jgi:hypothetical protein
MFNFDVKIVKFENPSETWFQVLIIKFIFGIPYYKTYHTTGYGEHTRDIKYDTYDDAKKDKIRLHNMLKTKYNTKTTKTVMD